MNTFRNLSEATIAAELFFIENFGHNLGVGIESRNGNVVEFYSKQDPGMDDTFKCIIK